MQDVRFEVRGKQARISFKSRYRDENDYIVSLAHGPDGEVRVRRYDDGRVVSCSPLLTDEEAATAIAAHEKAEAEDFRVWRERNAHLFGDAPQEARP